MSDVMIVSNDATRERRAGPDAAQQTEADRKASLLADALDKFKLVCEAEGDQRAREKEDLEFDRALPEDQWPENIRKSRDKIILTNGTIIPERPCLVINKLDQPIQQIINEGRNARLGLSITPKNRKATPAGAELRRGALRRIQADSNASVARMWAFERAVKCGRGFYRILTKYANDEDFDLDIVVALIKNQGAVYLDPYYTEPDGSDANWGLIIEDMRPHDYLVLRREYGGKLYDQLSGRDAGSADSTSLFESETDRPKDWITKDSVRVAEFFYFVTTAIKVVEDPETGRGRPLAPGEKPPKGIAVRTVTTRKLKWCLLNALEVLEERDWLGRWIPIVVVPGKEYVVDGKERVWKGVVSNAKDAQRSYNYMRSSQIEAVALGSKGSWVAEEGQIDGHPEWHDATVRNYSVLTYRGQMTGGPNAPPPHRDVQEPPIAAISQAVRESDNDIKATTGRWDPSLGQLSGERSGTAIRELKLQGESASSNYLENLATISMTHEGRIELDLLKHVYRRHGQIVRLLGEQSGDVKEITIGEPYIVNKKGEAQDAPKPSMLGKVANFMAGEKLPAQQMYTFDDDGEYAVQVTVGRAQATEKDAAMEAIATLIEATKGAAAPYLVDLYAELLDDPIGKRIAERMVKMNPQLAAAEGDAQEVPPQIAAQMQQMQQQLQAMQAALAQAHQAIESDAQKLEAEAIMQQAKLRNEMQVARLKIAGDLLKTQTQTESKELIALLETQAQRVTDEEERASRLDLERLKGFERRKDAAVTAALGLLMPKPAAGAAKNPAKGDDTAPAGRGATPAFELPPPPVSVGPGAPARDPRLS